MSDEKAFKYVKRMLPFFRAVVKKSKLNANLRVVLGIMDSEGIWAGAAARNFYASIYYATIEAFSRNIGYTFFVHHKYSHNLEHCQLNVLDNHIPAGGTGTMPPKLNFAWFCSHNRITNLEI